MKIDTIPGEFMFKALVIQPNGLGWLLTDHYYGTKEDAAEDHGTTGDYIKWPVQVFEDGSIYVADKEEYQNDRDD